MRPRQMNAEAHKALQSSSESLSSLLAQVIPVKVGHGKARDCNVLPLEALHKDSTAISYASHLTSRIPIVTLR